MHYSCNEQYKMNQISCHKKTKQVFFPNLSFMSAQVLVAQIVQGTSVNAKTLSLSLQPILIA